MPTIDELLGATPAPKGDTIDDILGTVDAPEGMTLLAPRRAPAVTLTEEQRRGLMAVGGQAAVDAVESGGRASSALKTVNEAEGQSLIPLVLSTMGAFATPGGPVAKAAGAATGATVGEAITPAVFTALGKEAPPSPSLFDLARTFGLTFLLDLAGQGIMKAASKLPGIRARPDAQETLTAFRETGVEPKATDISASRLPAVLERGVAQTPLGGTIISETAEKQAGQILSARDQFFQTVRTRGAESDVAAGTTARDAIKAQVARVKGVEDYLWQDLRGAAADMPVNLAPLKRAATDAKLQMERRGELSGTLVNDKLSKLSQDILKHGDTAPWQKVDEWRRAFGEGVQSSELFTGLSKGQQERFYAASLESMERAMATSDIPGLALVFKHVRQFGAQARALYKDGAVADIMDVAPEKVIGLLQGKGGPTAVKDMREAIIGSPRMGRVTPDPDAMDTWNLVRRHILEGVFEKGVDRSAKGFTSEPLSGVKLQAAVDKIGRATLDELLTPVERKGLDNILKVSKAVRLGERAAGTGFASNTAQMLSVNALFTGAGAVAGNVVGAPGVGAMLGGAFGPLPLAAMLTSPKSAAFLASPRFSAAAALANTAGRGAGEVNRALMRAAGIWHEENARDSRIKTERGR